MIFLQHHAFGRRIQIIGNKNRQIRRKFFGADFPAFSQNRNIFGEFRGRVVSTFVYFRLFVFEEFQHVGIIKLQIEQVDQLLV